MTAGGRHDHRGARHRVVDDDALEAEHQIGIGKSPTLTDRVRAVWHGRSELAGALDAGAGR